MHFSRLPNLTLQISFKGFDHIATALTYFKRVPPTTYTLLSKSSGSVLDRKVPVSTLTKAFKTPLLSLSVEEREGQVRR